MKGTRFTGGYGSLVHDSLGNNQLEASTPIKYICSRYVCMECNLPYGITPVGTGVQQTHIKYIK